jgi:hypothetical protein
MAKLQVSTRVAPKDNDSQTENSRRAIEEGICQGCSNTLRDRTLV